MYICIYIYHANNANPAKGKGERHLNSARIHQQSTVIYDSTWNKSRGVKDCQDSGQSTYTLEEASSGCECP